MAKYSWSWTLLVTRVTSQRAKKTRNRILNRQNKAIWWLCYFRRRRSRSLLLPRNQRNPSPAKKLKSHKSCNISPIWQNWTGHGSLRLPLVLKIPVCSSLRAWMSKCIKHLPARSNVNLWTKQRIITRSASQISSASSWRPSMSSTRIVARIANIVTPRPVPVKYLISRRWFKKMTESKREWKARQGRFFADKTILTRSGPIIAWGSTSLFKFSFLAIRRSQRPWSKKSRIT